jgi:hypothetical protein
VAAEEIDVNQAIDRLITTFDARAWRDDGNTARSVARAAAASGGVDAAALAGVVGSVFLTANRVGRSDVQRAIAVALRGVIVVESAAKTAETNSVNIGVGSTFIGNVGSGGTVAGGVHVQQQQALGDEAIRALAAKYADRPDVREIVTSALPQEEKKSASPRFSALQAAGHRTRWRR